MNCLSQKVLWSEGILLSQQHFQQFELSIARRLNALLHLSSENPWGLQRLLVDKRGLYQQRFTVSELIALMPNGQWAQLSDNDTEINTLVLTDEAHDIYFNVPDNHHVVGLKGYPDISAQACGWQLCYEKTNDLLDEQRAQEVTYIKPNGYLSFESQRVGFTSIKIARVIKHEDGYQLDENYIPPILHLSVSTHYQNKIQALEALLYSMFQSQKKDSHYQTFEKKQHSLSLILQMISQLTVLLNKGGAHPEDVFDCLHQGLIALSLSVASQWPTPISYKHEDIAAGIDAMLDKLNQLKTKLTSKQVKRLTLLPQKPGLFVLDKIDISDFNHNWFVEIHVKHRKLTDFYESNDHIKLSDKITIHALIQGSLPGIRLIADTPNKDIFRVDKTDNGWQELLKSQSVAVFVGDRVIDSVTIAMTES